MYHRVFGINFLFMFHFVFVFLIIILHVLLISHVHTHGHVFIFFIITTFTVSHSFLFHLFTLFSPIFSTNPAHHRLLLSNQSDYLEKLQTEFRILRAHRFFLFSSCFIIFKVSDLVMKLGQFLSTC